MASARAAAMACVRCRGTCTSPHAGSREAQVVFETHFGSAATDLRRGSARRIGTPRRHAPACHADLPAADLGTEMEVVLATLPNSPGCASARRMRMRRKEEVTRGGQVVEHRGHDTISTRWGRYDRSAQAFSPSRRYSQRVGVNLGARGERIGIAFDLTQ